MPVFLLQRHTVELLIKKLLSWCFEIADMRIQLDGSIGVRLLAPPEEVKKRASRSHDLFALLRDLHSQMIALEQGRPPTSLDELVELVSRFEPDHTWSRYETSGPQKRTQKTDAEVAVPLVQIQNDLDSVATEVLWSSESPEDTLEGQLYDDWQALFHRIEARGDA